MEDLLDLIFDVEKIAHMYGVDYDHMHKSPLVSDFRNPAAMRHCIGDFLCFRKLPPIF